MSNIYEEIISQSNIQTILEYYGLIIEKNKCLCPFHTDSHPSMNIHPSKGIAKCFVCNNGGNAISFIQKYETEINHNPISIKDAMQKAIDIQRLNLSIPTNRDDIPLTEEQKKQRKRTNILKDTIAICETTLKINKESLDYLQNRKLSTEIINSFHIGFCSGNILLNELIKKYDIQDLLEVGIIKEYNNSYVDVFSQRIMIPIFDKNGNPVGFGARTIDDNTKPKYINTVTTTLFNKSKLLFNYHKAKYFARNDEIILVEGYMDVISGKAIGFDNIVGTMGIAITKEHIELLKELKCDITLSLDNDDAGKNAMIRIIPELLKQELKVNVLDISRLGNYKDFGDLLNANISREQIYQTKISAFTFLMQEKYLKSVKLNVNNISIIYQKMINDDVINNSKDIIEFKEVIMQNTNYSSEKLDKIIKPTEIEKQRIDRYKNVFFYNYIIELIKQYAEKNTDMVLLKYLATDRLDMATLMKTINKEEYLKDGELTIHIGSYIRDFIYKSEDYIDFKNDKKFILEKLLNNVKSFDSKGNKVDIELSIEQKEVVINQYNETLKESTKEYIENHPDEFEELFIANNYKQFENLFPKTYVDVIKEQEISKFKETKSMGAVRYGLAYSDDIKSAMSMEIVNNEKYKTLLVFNNTNNVLNLSEKNIKQYNKEETKEIEQVQEYKEEKVKSKPMNIFIKISGREKETSKGIYLPINDVMEIFIPRTLYRLNDDKLEILNDNSNKAIMSEYKVNPTTRIKEWVSRLTLDDFYHKHFNLYEIQRDKEVVYNAG